MFLLLVKIDQQAFLVLNKSLALLGDVESGMTDGYQGLFHALKTFLDSSEEMGLSQLGRLSDGQFSPLTLADFVSSISSTPFPNPFLIPRLSADICRL